jgi:hypothetical protein
VTPLAARGDRGAATIARRGAWVAALVLLVALLAAVPGLGLLPPDGRTPPRSGGQAPAGGGVGATQAGQAPAGGAGQLGLDGDRAGEHGGEGSGRSGGGGGGGRSGPG